MQTYLVGGAIRDFLLNRPVVERDYLVVNSTIEEMLEKGFIQVGKDFPVFLHPVTKDEYALARVERKIGTGYYGFKCDSSKAVTLEEDLVRRDLTINAMCYDVSSALSSRSVERAFEKLSDFQGTSLEEGTFEETLEVPSEVSETFEKTERLNEDKIIDPFGGKSDIQNRILRHVSDAFAEDPVRVLRVARFMARYYSLGFRVAPETMELMKLIVSKGEIDNLVPERVWKELEKALSEKDPQLFFETLRECGALHVLLPNFYVDVHPIKWPSADYIDSNYSLGLDALKLTQNFSKEIRLAAFLHTMNYKEIEKLALRFRFPNSYKELAVLVARYSDLAIGLANVSEPEKATKKKMELANAFLNLFNSLNVIHQIERFEDFLNTVNAIFKIEDENREFPVQMFLEMASRYKEESSKLTQKLLSEGISGKKMATVLEQERLKFLVMIK